MQNKLLRLTFLVCLAVVMSSATGASWNRGVAAEVGDIAEFYSVHSYYTPWNTDSDVATVLDSYKKTDGYKTYIWNEMAAVGMPKLPKRLRNTIYLPSAPTWLYLMPTACRRSLLPES